MELPLHIQNKLSLRNSSGSLRKLSLQEGKVDFSSNDFFGLARNKELIQIINHRYNNIKDKFSGSTGSRLLSGNTKFHEELELLLANIHKADSALLFNSGYNANLGLLSSLPQKGDTILLDEKVHASIKDGSRLSFAKKLTFKHNNSEDLERKLQISDGEKYVVVESLYSMDGDFCDIENILSVCENNNAYLIVDEAHTTGIFGAAAGWCVEKGVEKRVFARIITFGKALGCFGAAILGSNDLKNYLINFARPFIYTTALPLYNLIAIELSFDFISKNNFKGKLDENIELYKSMVPDSTDSYIQTVCCGSAKTAQNTAQNLQDNGYDIRAILSPTVPEGEEMLRICLHSFNTSDELLQLASLLK